MDSGIETLHRHRQPRLQDPLEAVADLGPVHQPLPGGAASVSSTSRLRATGERVVLQVILLMVLWWPELAVVAEGAAGLTISRRGAP